MSKKGPLSEKELSENYSAGELLQFKQIVEAARSSRRDIFEVLTNGLSAKQKIKYEEYLRDTQEDVGRIVTCPAYLQHCEKGKKATDDKPNAGQGKKKLCSLM